MSEAMKGGATDGEPEASASVSGSPCPLGHECPGRFSTSTGEARPGELHASSYCLDCGRALHATFTLDAPESPNS